MKSRRVRLRAQLGDMNIVGHDAGAFELIAGRLPQVEMELACGTGLEPAIESDGGVRRREMRGKCFPRLRSSTDRWRGRQPL